MIWLSWIMNVPLSLSSVAEPVHFFAGFRLLESLRLCLSAQTFRHYLPVPSKAILSAAQQKTRYGRFGLQPNKPDSGGIRLHNTALQSTNFTESKSILLWMFLNEGKKHDFFTVYTQAMENVFPHILVSCLTSLNEVRKYLSLCRIPWWLRPGCSASLPIFTHLVLLDCVPAAAPCGGGPYQQRLHPPSWPGPTGEAGEIQSPAIPQV